MKKQQKLQDAIGLVGEDLILEAKAQKRKAIRFLRYWYIPSVAAAVIVAIVVGAFVWQKETPKAEDLVPPPVVQAKATPLAEGIYPTAIRYPDAAEYENYWEEWKDAYDAWRAERKKSKALAKEAGDQDAFILKTMEEFLGGEENRIYSPLNVYIALAMVAETVDGNSRAQILDLLGVSNIRQLREEATALWQSHYRDDELVFSCSLTGST